MSSRYSAARPKRAGESFARTHHGERRRQGSTDDDGGNGNDDDGPSSSSNKRVKFDVRNPSALAPDARRDSDDEDNDVLEADVIGKGAGATKRGAVNIDGYDSDSDNETFHARAAARKEDGVDIADKLDNYDRDLRGEDREEDKEDEDMFGADDDDDEGQDSREKANSNKTPGRKGKEVRFLDADKIEGQEATSRSGGTIRLEGRNMAAAAAANMNDNDEASSSDDDEADRELAIQEEGVDAEVGAGGLKRNAPKLDAFNMKAEQAEGAFDEAGNFIRKAADPDAVHDRWLDGVSKRDVRRAAEAHARREAETRRRRKQDDAVATEDLLRMLVVNLERGEAPLEALARLGKARARDKKKNNKKAVPKWKLKKQQQQQGSKKADDGEGGDEAAEAMDVDHKDASEDPEQTRIKDAINTITEAADKLLGREYAEIYETERELLIREWQMEAGERWVEPPRAAAGGGGGGGGAVAASEESRATTTAQEDTAPPPTTTRTKMWEYRWTDGRDGGAVQGPYDGATMKAWLDAGYFEGVEFRAVGGADDDWSRVADFV